MLNIKLQFKYESVFYDSCEDSAVINVDNVNDAIKKQYLMLSALVIN